MYFSEKEGGPIGAPLGTLNSGLEAGELKMQLQFYQSDAEFFPVDTGPFMVLSARDERAF